MNNVKFLVLVLIPDVLRTNTIHVVFSRDGDFRTGNVYLSLSQLVIIIVQPLHKEISLVHDSP